MGHVIYYRMYSTVPESHLTAVTGFDYLKRLGESGVSCASGEGVPPPVSREP